MLNVAVPFEINTVHSDRYNYRSSIELSPSGSRQGSVQPEKSEEPRSRRSSGFAGEDEHSHTLAEPIADAPPVIVFFSFMNEHSKKWAVEYQVVNTLRRNVRQGTTISRYHVPTRTEWSFGEELTHAWAVAKSLQVDDKVIVPLFDGVHSKRIHDLEGIRTVFDECGISPQQFLREWGKKGVLYDKQNMDEAVNHIDLQEVPAILVNGKYLVKLDSYEKDFNADRAVDLVKTLLKRD